MQRPLEGGSGDRSMRFWLVLLHHLTPLTRPPWWLALVPVLVSSSILAQEPDRLADLRAIRRQIADLEVQIARIDEEKSGLEAELARTGAEVELQERQVAEARAEREMAEEELRLSEARERELEESLARVRDGLRVRLASLYFRDERDLLRSFLAAEGEDGALDDMRLLRLLARRDGFWIEEYRTAREKLLNERQVLSRRREEVETTSAREAMRLRRLRRTQVAQRRALDLMSARRTGVSAKVSELVSKEEKVSLLVSILAGRETTPPQGIAIQDFAGALDWPSRGSVLKGFGPRSEARYRTKVPHNGVEIATRPRSAVRVVFPGVVVFSAPFEDFGLTVVVHHRERVFSLYAGLETVEVQKNDVVSFSDVLGAARSSMYFEIRVENQPQDPLKWFR